MGYDNQNSGYGGGYRNNNQEEKLYCGGLTKEWKQSQRGNWEKISAWFSLKQLFEHAYGEQGWQQVSSMLQSLQPVNQLVIKNSSNGNGDMYVKVDYKERRTPSQTGDTHSATINTYVAQQQQQQQPNVPYQGQQQQGGYQQPYTVGAPPVQSYPPQAGASTPGQPNYNAGQSHVPAVPQPPAPAPVEQQQIPGLPPAPAVGQNGYPETWDNAN